jgi:uncharacterized phage-associated protein
VSDTLTEQKTYGIRELANWILDFADSRSLAVTNMSLNKLLYFAYEHALIAHGRKLTQAKIEAWEHGPVFREVYKSFNEFGNKPITSRASKFNPATGAVETASPHLLPRDAEIVMEAIANIIHLPASVLREISHADAGPWAATWYHEQTTNPGMQISDEVIRLNSGTRKILQ